MTKNKRIVTCAVTGSINLPTMSEYLPITPQQIAEQAVEAAAAGAAVVHIHARNPEQGFPSSDPKLFEEIINRIREKNKDVLICLTTGGGAGMTVEERAAVVPLFKPELASCNLNKHKGTVLLCQRLNLSEKLEGQGGYPVHLLKV